MSFADDFSSQIKGWSDGFQQVTGAVQDGLSPILATYFSYKQGEKGLELQNAASQQQAVQNAISTEQQVQQMNLDQAVAIQQAQAEQTQTTQAALMKYAPWAIGGALALVVLLKVAK